MEENNIFVLSNFLNCHFCTVLVMKAFYLSPRDNSQVLSPLISAENLSFSEFCHIIPFHYFFIKLNVNLERLGNIVSSDLQ